MALLLNHVEHVYGKGTAFEKVALYDINLQINEGEFIGLIGHTGSGKSTLIQHLNGLLKPTDGGVYYNGEDINEKGFSKKKLRSKVGIVFQYPEQQLFETTVLEDVKFGPKNLGLDNLEIDLRSYEALKQVGIGEDLLDVSPFELSGGQKRRVAIAGVLAMQPEILILDEPTAGLDPQGKDDILDLIEKLHRERKITVIVVWNTGGSIFPLQRTGKNRYSCSAGDVCGGRSGKKRNSPSPQCYQCKAGGRCYSGLSKRGEINVTRYYDRTILSGGIKDSQTGSPHEDHRGDLVSDLLIFVSEFCRICSSYGVSWCGHRVQSCAAWLYHERPETDFVFAFIYGMFPRVFYAGRRCAVSVEIYIDHKRRH